MCWGCMALQHMLALGRGQQLFRLATPALFHFTFSILVFCAGDLLPFKL